MVSVERPYNYHLPGETVLGSWAHYTLDKSGNEEVISDVMGSYGSCETGFTRFCLMNRISPVNPEQSCKSCLTYSSCLKRQYSITLRRQTRTVRRDNRDC